MENLASLLPLILIIAVFYLLIMRPARNRQRQVRALQEQVGIGARVVTTAGLYGTVVDVDADTIVLDTGLSPAAGLPASAPGPRSRWARGAVGRVIEPAPSAAAGSLDGAAGAASAAGAAGADGGQGTASIDLTKKEAAPYPDSDAGPPRS